MNLIGKYKTEFMRKLIIIILMAGIISFDPVFSQEKRGITISGVLLQADSLMAIPYGSIAVKNNIRGTVTNNLGHFSIVVDRFDTLVFSAIGYKNVEFVVPNLVDSDYSLIQLLQRETILLQEVEVVAWPDERSFIRAFHEFKLPKGEEDRIFNMEMELNEVLRDQYEKDKFYYDQMRYSKLYTTTGFMAPNNFLNPITWSNFIRDWRSGAFKTKKK